MLVLTFQDKDTARKLKKHSYKPILSKSTYARTSVEFSIGYNKILKELKRKDKSLLEDESCMWGWIFAPSEGMISRLIDEDKVAIYLDIDESKVVFSDYDKYSDFVLGDSTDTDFIIKDINSAKRDNICVQCSFGVEAINYIQGVYSCETFLLYSEIQRCFYSQMLSASASFKKPTLMDKLNILINRYYIYKVDKLNTMEAINS